jgi:hypothetical protein
VAAPHERYERAVDAVDAIQGLRSRLKETLAR